MVVDLDSVDASDVGLWVLTSTTTGAGCCVASLPERAPLGRARAFVEGPGVEGWPAEMGLLSSCGGGSEITESGLIVGMKPSGGIWY
jgi:hypothetical protein